MFGTYFTLLSSFTFNELLSSSWQLGGRTSPPFPDLWITKFIDKIFCQNLSFKMFLPEFFRLMFTNILMPIISAESFSSKFIRQKRWKIYWFLLFDNLSNLRREDFHLKHSSIYLHLFSINASTIEGNRHLLATSVKLLRSKKFKTKEPRGCHVCLSYPKTLKEITDFPRPLKFTFFFSGWQCQGLSDLIRFNCHSTRLWLCDY